MRAIYLICFAVCLTCIIIGTTISILAIWKVVADKEFFWRSLMTLGVLFFASILTASINAFIPLPNKKRDNPLSAPNTKNK